MAETIRSDEQIFQLRVVLRGCEFSFKLSPFFS